MYRIKFERGFTLLEVMIALVVLSVILAIGAPSLNTFLERQAIKADAQTLSKALTTARMQAMLNEETATTVCWQTTSDKVYSVGGENYKVVSGSYAVLEGSSAAMTSILMSGALVGDSSYVALNGGANACAGFDSQGRLIGAGATPLAFVYCQKAGTSEHALRVEVSLSGRIATRHYSDPKSVTALTCA